MATEHTVVMHDAETETIQLKRVDASGVIISARGYVIINLADALTKGVSLTEMGACDPATGASKKVVVLASDPY